MKKAVVRSAVGKAHKRVVHFIFRDRYGHAIEIGFSHALCPVFKDRPIPLNRKPKSSASPNGSRPDNPPPFWLCRRDPDLLGDDAAPLFSNSQEAKRLKLLMSYFVTDKSVFGFPACATL